MTTRIYVGGLGERVTEEDLRKTFSNLGSVESVDIIRSKGRSFAYINFLPFSDNSLAKLFSMYNGCSWKGGKLKLEKAKEHYVDRLEREWAEDAELKDCENINHVGADEFMVPSAEPKSTLDSEKMQIRIFFPKLRKVKSLPFRGTGKHKYSFQRVEARVLPVHFCDCPEHSDPVQTHKERRVYDSVIQNGTITKEKIMNRLFDRETSSKSEHFQSQRESQVHDSEIQHGGMDEEEIHLINSVMKKLLDREPSSKTGQNAVQISPRQNFPTSDFPVETNEMDDGTDDDDIKINMVTGRNNGSISSECWELQTSLLTISDGQQGPDYSGTQSKPRVQERKVRPSDKKRKSLSSESNETNPASPVRKKKTRLQTRSNESEERMKNMKSKPVGDGGHTFSLSHTTSNWDSDREERAKPGTETSYDSKEHEWVDHSFHETSDGQPLPPNEKDGHLAAQPSGPSAGSDKSIKGGSWLQKSSWTRLVGGGNNGSFSISQILPGNILEKQDSHKPNGFSAKSSSFDGAIVKEKKTSQTTQGGGRGSKPSFCVSNKKSDSRVSTPKGKALSDNNFSGLATEKPDFQPKQTSNAVPIVGISESCPFMRSTESMKDWKTAKTALSNALKKKNKK